MMTIAKCFSVLVASGNGQLCNHFKSDLKELLQFKDEFYNEYRVSLYKFGGNKELVSSISQEVAQVASIYLKDVDRRYFGKDL